MSAIIAVFGAWGWLTHYGILPERLATLAGGVLMAGVCLVSQGMCNSMAVEAREARAQGLMGSFHAATAVALGFGAISAMGLHHGWEIAQAMAPPLAAHALPGPVTTALFLFLALGEPASFWIMAANRAKPAPMAPDQVDPPRPDWRLGPSALAAAAVAGLAVAPAPVGFPAGGSSAIAGAEAPFQPQNAADDEIRRLSHAGLSERAIAEQLGITRHAVRKRLGR